LNTLLLLHQSAGAAPAAELQQLGCCNSAAGPDLVQGKLKLAYLFMSFFGIINNFIFINLN
jgi:hypothetical protein